jgi:hypothetical protein
MSPKRSRINPKFSPRRVQDAMGYKQNGLNDGDENGEARSQKGLGE